MPPASGSREEDARLSGARAEFVGSLPRRLDALRGALELAEQGPGEPDRINSLLRRVHAVGSAARVLGFASVAEALAEAERSVRKPGPRSGEAPFADVARALDLLPSLVLGAPVSARGPESRERSAPAAFPISALVLGSQALADALTAGAGKATVECERTDDLERALELARMLGPDVAVVDGDHAGARDLVRQLLGDDLVEPVPIVVVGSFDNPESTRAFVELGVERVLPKPCSPDTLRRTVEELRERARPRTAREPLGDVSVQSLVERISVEFRRGLLDALDSGSPSMQVPLGEGNDVLSAVWGAVARVRELVTLRSSGELRFQQTGPEGGVPLVPWGGSERRAGERGPRAREVGGVSLKGRRVLVADDDPAVVWFMGGLLKAVGVEVIEAHDGKRALAKTFEAWPDVVVSDVMMPKLDGFSLCHEIKRDVVVRDTPVILLSWKEDLLQRVRELGVGADGYLRKEAAASAVVERVREVLRARARVEERIEAGGEVRGRLDGLTTRLVLELACKKERNVRVSVRDAAYLFEAQVRRGRLVSLTRSTPDGGFERGASMLPSLLGATAGRFVVEPDSSPVRSELSGTLSELVRAPVAKARSALLSVAAGSLVRLRKIELDRPLVEAYLASTPEPASGLTRRLLAGETARSLVLEGGVGSRLLETVLSDIARRGGVLAAELDAPSVPAPVSDPPPAPAPFVPGMDFAAIAASAEGALVSPTGATAPTGFIASSAETATTVSAPAINLLAPNLQTASRTDGEDDAGWFAEGAAVTQAMTATPAPDEADQAPGATPAREPLAELDPSDVAPAMAAALPTPEPAPSPDKTLESAPPPLAVVGFGATLPLSRNVTPAVDVVVSNFAPEQRTLEGVGVPRVEVISPVKPAELAELAKPQGPASPRAPESSSPDLTTAESTEELLGLLADSDVESAKAAPLSGRAAQAGTSAKRPVVVAEATSARGETRPEPAGESRAEPAGWGVLLLRGGLAFGAAFAVTSWLLPVLSPAPSGSENAEPDTSAQAVAPRFRLVADELALPSGLELGATEGLIEVETAGPDAIYVDGQLVGSGPIRRVTAAPGPHRVEVRGSGAPLTQDVTLVAGRRARVRTAPADPAQGVTTGR